MQIITPQEKNPLKNMPSLIMSCNRMNSSSNSKDVENREPRTASAIEAPLMRIQTQSLAFPSTLSVFMMTDPDLAKKSREG